MKHTRTSLHRSITLVHFEEEYGEETEAQTQTPWRLLVLLGKFLLWLAKLR